MYKKNMLVFWICIMLLLGEAQALNFQGKPDWLCGSLLLNTMTSGDIILNSDQKPVAQAICMINFDNGSLTAVDVPSNGTLISNMLNGTPMIIYPQNPCYSVTETAYPQYNWRNFSYTYLVVSEKGLEALTSYDQIFTSHYPIALLSLTVGEEEDSFFGKTPIYTRIYLCYGVSDDGKSLTPQLIAEIGGDNGYNSDIRVLKTFDDERLGRLFFAFSKEKCAISDLNDTIRAISIESLSEIVCPEKADGAICWLDDRIIFCVNSEWHSGEKRHSILKMWDTETNAVSSLAELWGESEIDLSEGQYPLCMSVNGDSTILAIYYGSSIDEEHTTERGGKIVFVSLTSGETYEIIPWENSHKSKYTCSYSKTDNGKVIYNPSSMIDNRLAWYCEW